MTEQRPIPDDAMAGLTWYVECRLLALAQVQQFRPPADGKLMRLTHGLYLMHLQSLLDLAAEFDPGLSRRWQVELDGLGGQSGENNAAYLRELRNTVIKRGGDATMRGTVVNGFTVSLAPATVWGRETKKGRSGPFTAFEPLLWNMFAVVEQALPRALASVLKRIERQLLAFDGSEARQQYLETVVADDFLPDWARRMAVEQVDQIPFAEIHAQRVAEVRRLLGEPGIIGRLEPDQQ